MLDCCSSGSFGNLPEIENKVAIKEGISILTACRADEFAEETQESGLFTSLVCDALNGGAADFETIQVLGYDLNHKKESYGSIHEMDIHLFLMQ